MTDANAQTGGTETDNTHPVAAGSGAMRIPPATDEIAGDAMLSSMSSVIIEPGMRVELTGTPTAVTLRGRTGSVARPDEDDAYVIVALDTPAQYHHANGDVEDLPEIVVMTDNLRILGS